MNRYLFPAAALFGALMPLVFDSAIKGAVLLATAALVAIALWRASAAARHLVWLVAIVALLVVPVLSLALPQWRVLPQWAVVERGTKGTKGTEANKRTTAPVSMEDWQPIAEDEPFSEAPLPAPAPMRAVASAPVDPVVSSVPSVSRPWTSSEWLPFAWCAGFALLIVPLLAAHLLLRCAARHCPALTAPPDEKIAAAFADACARLGIRQRVTLLLDKKRTIPVVWGVFRPRLMLPLEARDWSDEQLCSVLLHELGHIKRRDTLVQWLTQIACALHWWNPLVWLAAWRLHTERERACDDLVLASGVRPSAYAEHLLDVATRLSPARWTSACGLAMARKSSLEGRLMAVLSEKLNRNGVTRALAIAALLLGAAIALPVAMLRAADEKPAEPPASAENKSGDIRKFNVSLAPEGVNVNPAKLADPIAIQVGVGDGARVIVHPGRITDAPLTIKCSADDRDGRWWNVVYLVKKGEPVYDLPILPDGWMQKGRFVFRKVVDGYVVADIESGENRVPVSVRPATPVEKSKMVSLALPTTSARAGIIIDGRLHTARRPLDRSRVVPSLVAQDFIGEPNSQLVRPMIYGPNVRDNPWDKGAAIFAIETTLTGDGVKVQGHFKASFPDKKYDSPSGLFKVGVVLQGKEPVKNVSAQIDATLGVNDVAVIPIETGDSFPQSVVAVIGATVRPLERISWTPPEHRPPIEADGWVLKWPRSDGEWFRSLFDYEGFPQLLELALARRGDPPTKDVWSETISSLSKKDVEKLVAQFRTKGKFPPVRVEPFKVQPPEHPSMNTPKDRTQFLADGEPGTIWARADGQHISPAIAWDKPLIPHVSGGYGSHGIRPGDSIAVLLPGFVDAKEVRMLVLRCNQPNGPSVLPPLAAKPQAPAKVTVTVDPNQKAEITFTNSLGVDFVRSGNVDFARNLVRVKDYELFAAANPGVGKLQAPGFPQTPDHPVVNVTWKNAVAFCEWLTNVEREKGLLKPDESYRLPTDLEWSAASGMPAEKGATPEARDLENADLFAWGTAWPPPPGVGNYAGEETKSEVRIQGYRDDYPCTSPVGSFQPNALGLFDMGGNVWQWVMDDFNESKERKVLRGGSWYNGGVKPSLLLSCRYQAKRDASNDTYGFRIVKASTKSNSEGNEVDLPKRAEAWTLWDYRKLTEPKLSSPSAAPASPDYRTNVTGELDKDLVDKLERRTRSSIILPDTTSKFLTDTKVAEAKERYEAMKRLFEAGSIPSHIFYGAQGSYFEALRGRSVVALGERSAALRDKYSSALEARSTPLNTNAKRENSNDTTGEQNVPNSIKIAVEPGRYNLGGDVNLSVTRQRINGKQHDGATIQLPAIPTPAEPGARIYKNDKGKVVRVDGEKTVMLRQPYKIDRAQGARNWAFAWELDSGTLWLSEDGVIRSFSFGLSSAVKVTLFDAANAEQIPSDINGAFKKVFETQGTASDTVSQASEKTGSVVAPRLPDIRADLVPIQARQWNEKYAAVAYQTEKDVNFVLIHEGFISTGLSESSSDNGKWSIEGNIHLVDAEKTKAAGQNVDKRKVALKYTSDAPGTLILDGKEYDLNSKGRVFILRDQGEPEQLDKTMPLRDKADLEKLGALIKKTPDKSELPKPDAVPSQSGARLWDFQLDRQRTPREPNSSNAIPRYVNWSEFLGLDSNLVAKLGSREGNLMKLMEPISRVLAGTTLSEAREQYEVTKRLFEAGSIPSHVFYLARDLYFTALKERTLSPVSEGTIPREAGSQ